MRCAASKPARHKIINCGRLMGYCYLLVCVAGCFSTGTYESARTVPRAEIRYSGKASITLLPHFGATIKYGLTSNSDAGLTLTTFPGIGMHYKYRFLGSNESLFASSIGMDAQYFYAPTFFRKPVADWARNVLSHRNGGMMMLAQINSFQVSEKLGLFIATKAGHLFVKPYYGDNWFYSAAFGLKHKSRKPVFISGEVTYFHQNQFTKRVLFWTMGIGWEF